MPLATPITAEDARKRPLMGRTTDPIRATDPIAIGLQELVEPPQPQPMQPLPPATLTADDVTLPTGQRPQPPSAPAPPNPADYLLEAIQDPDSRQAPQYDQPAANKLKLAAALGLVGQLLGGDSPAFAGIGQGVVQGAGVEKQQLDDTFDARMQAFQDWRDEVMGENADLRRDVALSEYEADRSDFEYQRELEDERAMTQEEREAERAAARRKQERELERIRAREQAQLDAAIEEERRLRGLGPSYSDETQRRRAEIAAARERRLRQQEGTGSDDEPNTREEVVGQLQDTSLRLKSLRRQLAAIPEAPVSEAQIDLQERLTRQISELQAEWDALAGRVASMTPRQRTTPGDEGQERTTLSQQPAPDVDLGGLTLEEAKAAGLTDAEMRALGLTP